MFALLFGTRTPRFRFKSNFDRIKNDATQRAMNHRRYLCYRYRSTYLQFPYHTECQNPGGSDPDPQRK